MARRIDARNSVVDILFSIKLGNDGALNLKEYFFENKKVRNQQREFANSLLNGVLQNLEEIDKHIKTALLNWEFENVAPLELSILRVGVYELLFTNTPKAVVINEAISLANRLCEDKASKFINGILDSIKKEKI